MKCKSTSYNLINDCDMCLSAFGKNTVRSYKHFKCFFPACDAIKQTPAHATHPNWEVPCMSKHTLYVPKLAVYIDKYIIIDKQTISCKDNHVDILWINLKKDGDSFQCNVLCSNVYQPAPKEYIDVNVLPLHA